MDFAKLESDITLQQVLWACYQYWQTEETILPNRRSICYTWILPIFKETYGIEFHPSKLQQLSKLGFLKPEDTSRTGKRRYYSIINAKNVSEYLVKWG